MKLFFIFPLSGPNNGVKVISNHIQNALSTNQKFLLYPVDTAQAEGYNNFGKFKINKVVSFFKLLKKLKSIKANDCIYFNFTPKGYAFYRDLLILIVCIIKTKNITAHIHANGLENNIKWYNRFLFKRIKIIVINKHQKKNIIKFCPNTFLIPNALPDYFKNKNFIFKKNEEINLIFLSNISEEKGVNRIKTIAEILFLNDIKCKINVFGGALKNSGERKMNELAIKYNFVNYYGPIINEEDKFLWLLSNDLLLFLSDENYEVYPLVYLEALMCGLPIITTKQIVSSDLQKLGVAQVLNNDMSNFIEIINKFVSIKPWDLEDLKEKTRTIYSEKYSFKSYIKKIEEAILYDTKTSN